MFACLTAVYLRLHSELDPSQASARDPGTGELLFGWSNVCMHWFTLSFLHAAAERLQREAAYHVARKQIPSVEGPVKVLVPRPVCSCCYRALLA